MHAFYKTVFSGSQNLIKEGCDRAMQHPPCSELPGRAGKLRSCINLVLCPSYQALTPALLVNTCSTPSVGAKHWELKACASFSTLASVSFIDKINMFVFHIIREDTKLACFQYCLGNVRVLWCSFTGSVIVYNTICVLCPCFIYFDLKFHVKND